MVNLSSLAGGMAGGAAITIVIKAIDDYSKETDKAKKNILGMSKGATVALAGIATAAILVGKGMLDLSLKAAEFNDRLDAFKSLTGDLYAPLLSSLKSATYGTVSSMDLITSANQAMIMGVDAKTLPNMFNAAKIMADSAGKSTIEVINDLASGIGKQNERVLKSYGVFVDAEKVYEDYAKSIGKTTKALTEQEKKTAFSIAAMKELSEQTKRLGGYSEDVSDKMERLNALWEDYKIQLGEATTGIFPNIIDGMNAYLTIMNKEDEVVFELARKYGALGAVVDMVLVPFRAATIEAQDQAESTELLAKMQSGAILTTQQLGKAQGIAEGELEGLNKELNTEKTKLGEISSAIDKLLGRQVAGEAEAGTAIFETQDKLDRLENQMLKDTAEKRAELKAQGVKDIEEELQKWQSTDSPYLAQQSQVEDLKESLAILESDKKIDFTNNRIREQMSMDNQKAAKEGILNNFTEMRAGLKTLFNDWVAEFDRVLAKQNEVIAKNAEIAGYKSQTTGNTNTGNSWTDTSGTEHQGLLPGWTVSDFVITPQGVLNTHPDDFIIGTKNPAGLGGGTTIIIEGNIYGVDPDQISEALYNRLSEGIKY